MSSHTIQQDADHIHTPIGTDLKLEVVAIPVADVDRAKHFYEHLGWRLDADFANGDDWRLVQMTPPGSQCSVMFGKGFTSAVPGSVPGHRYPHRLRFGCGTVLGRGSALRDGDGRHSRLRRRFE